MQVENDRNDAYLTSSPPLFTLGAMGVIVFAVISTIFGFAPTGLVALAHALGAWSGRHDPPMSEARSRRRLALKWCWVSVTIGGLVEVPVLATLASGVWHISPHAMILLHR